MIEDIKIDKRQRVFSYILIAVLLFVFSVGLFSSAIILPVLSSNSNVAYAAYTDDNLLYVQKNQSTSGMTFSNYTLSDCHFVFFNNGFKYDFSALNTIGTHEFFRYTFTYEGIVYKCIYSLQVLPPSSLGFTTTDNCGILSVRFVENSKPDDNNDITPYYAKYVLFNDTDKQNASTFGSLLFNDYVDITSVGSFDFNIITFDSFTYNSSIDWLPSAVSLSSTFAPGGSFSEDDINNAYNDGYSKGINDYLYNSGLVYPLNVDSYVSTGGFSVKDGAESHNILIAKSVENHTNNNTGTVDVYSFMPYGVNGNLIYTQGAAPTVTADFNGTAGYYGVKSSFGGNGVSSVIKAGTPFSLDMSFARSSSNKISGVYTNVDYTIMFLDKSMNPIYYNSSYSGDYYINNTILGMGSESNGMLLSDVLTSGDVHFYNFPVDLYGIMLVSYHNANEFAHAYSLTARFLGDEKSQEAYDNGFTAGVNSINKNDIFNQGYTKGFSEGSAEGSNYTFMSLLGAVIDAPISAFTGMFDFTLLGVNLRSFILAMLTLAIVIVLIRIALGGK